MRAQWGEPPRNWLNSSIMVSKKNSKTRTDQFICQYFCIITLPLIYYYHRFRPADDWQLVAYRALRFGDFAWFNSKKDVPRDKSQREILQQDCNRGLDKLFVWKRLSQAGLDQAAAGSALVDEDWIGAWWTTKQREKYVSDPLPRQHLLKGLPWDSQGPPHKNSLWRE